MKKPTGKPGYKASHERLLKSLDSASIGGVQPFFKTLDDKEYYETQLMFALRKRQAAKYHRDNVKRDLAQTVVDAKRQAEISAQIHKKSGGATQFSASVTHYKQDYVHELGAFLAALRSGLDFLAMPASRSIPGVKAYSINTLMKMAKNGQVGPALGVVNKHDAWLKNLKNYRDEVIHRLVVQAPTSGWRLSHKGKTSISTLPVVVPANTPKFAPDTRRSRMMENELPNGLTQSESFGSVTYSDGSEEVLVHAVTFSTASGYMLIEEFMDGHLKSYDAFLEEMFIVLAELKFLSSDK